MVRRIVHKHVSVDIRAGHDPIVGQHLLGAIAATQPLLDAWKEAHTSRANLLIAQWVSLLNHGVPAARLHREVFGPELLDHLL